MIIFNMKKNEIVLVADYKLRSTMYGKNAYSELITHN